MRDNGEKRDSRQLDGQIENDRKSKEDTIGRFEKGGGVSPCYTTEIENK